jgi:hypothetical protein
LLAADGVASRAIGRAVGCTTGTASKWRVPGFADLGISPHSIEQILHKILRQS